MILTVEAITLPELLIIAWNEFNILTAKCNSPALLDAVDKATKFYDGSIVLGQFCSLTPGA